MSKPTISYPLYLFKKSGSVVELVADWAPRFAGKPGAVVKRYDTGKEMFVLKEALVPLVQLSACHGELVWVTDDADQTEITVPSRKVSK